LLQLAPQIRRGVGIRLDNKAGALVTQVWVVEDVAKPRANLGCRFARLSAHIVGLFGHLVAHENEVFCKGQLLFLLLLLVLVVIFVGDYDAGHLKGCAVHGEGHLRDVDARVDELTLLALRALLRRLQLRKLAVAHREAEHFFLHFFGHAVVQKVFFGGGHRLLPLFLLTWPNSLLVLYLRLLFLALAISPEDGIRRFS